MADITVASFEQIVTMLSRLATNYSSLFIDYEKLFYNPIPQDVTVQIYNEEGKLETFTIPNRAKDRQYILNGEGSPEGVVFAGKGAIYQDLLNGRLYLKQVDDDASGWYSLVSNVELEEFIIKGNSSPEGSESAPLGTLFVNKVNGALYVKITSTGNTGWLLISANTDILADKDLSNLSDLGENHFANPDLSNLSIEGQELINSKENLANKVTSISSTSTDEQYPSAKLMFDTTKVLSNVNLSNLSTDGEEHFLGKTQVRDCILFSPNGGVSRAGNVLTFPTNTTVLGSGGANINGSHIQVKKTTGSNLSTLINWLEEGTGTLFLRFQKGATSVDTLVYCNINGYSRSEVAPQGYETMVWYNPRTNIYKYTSNSGATWVDYVMTEVAQFRTDKLGNIINVTPYYALSVTSEYELEALKDLLVSKSENMSATLEASIEDEATTRANTDNTLSTRITTNLASINEIKNNLITDYSSPSNTFTELTWELNKEYTAAKDGWFAVVVDFINGGCCIYNTETLLGDSCLGNFSSTTRGYCSVRVKAGQAVKIELKGDASVVNLRFIPAEGVK